MQEIHCTTHMFSDRSHTLYFLHKSYILYICTFMYICIYLYNFFPRLVKKFLLSDCMWVEKTEDESLN